ncbi:MAG: TetR/AcrR family transcriptional regulator [Gammaproteobacteria bacterium]
MRKRLSAPERRASIVEVAGRLFADKGFHGVSVDQIVSEVGVSPAVLYRHFSSKEQLYEAVLEELSGTREDYVEAVVETESDFAAVLRALTRVFVGSIAWRPELLRMELHSMLEGNEAARAFFNNRWKTFTDYIEFNLGELEQSGKIPALDKRAAGLMYQGMIREALLTKCLDPHDRFNEISLDALTDRLVDLFLDAVRYNAPDSA